MGLVVLHLTRDGVFNRDCIFAQLQTYSCHTKYAISMDSFENGLVTCRCNVRMFAGWCKEPVSWVEKI